jgi:hypothetical protein
VALLALAFGCGSDDGTLAPPLTASFRSSGTASAPNRVRLVSPTVSADTVVVDVLIGGPTTSADLYSFAFDLLLRDPSIAVYVPTRPPWFRSSHWASRSTCRPRRPGTG